MMLWGAARSDFLSYEGLINWYDPCKVKFGFWRKKSAPIQFYSNSHNSQYDRWIQLKFYMESPDMLSYLGLINIYWVEVFVSNSAGA
jgi:hypothetical protein